MELNDLLKGIRRRRERIGADQRETEELLRWASTGQVPDRQIRWVVDTRKMTVLSQLHDFARQAQNVFSGNLRDTHSSSRRDPGIAGSAGFCGRAGQDAGVRGIR